MNAAVNLINEGVLVMRLAAHWIDEHLEDTFCLRLTALITKSIKLGGVSSMLGVMVC